MLFADGVRIDLAFDPLALAGRVGEDSLARVLLDKDGRIPPLPPESDRGYHITRPDARLFAETLNEIFWCANNTARGLWRGELAYHKYMQESIVRPCLVRLLEWYAAMQHGWTIGTGSYGKWLRRYLPPGLWAAFTRTCAGAEDDDCWLALFATCRLARQVGLPLAEHLGYPYPLEDDRRVLAYLEWVRERALAQQAGNLPPIC